MDENLNALSSRKATCTCSQHPRHPSPNTFPVEGEEGGSVSNACRVCGRVTSALPVTLPERNCSRTRLTVHIGVVA
jgi:hypothetical protein